MKAIPTAPGGTLHDYVPFFFAPRPPMLLAIDKGNVPGCDYRQDDIVHVVSQAQTMGEIDWRIFFDQPLLGGYCKHWNNRPDPPRHVRRQETRQAEFLVHQRVPIAAVSLIGVRTAEGEARIRAALAGTGWDPAVRAVPTWYY